MVTPAAHGEAAANLRLTYEMSERRACRVIGTDRTSVRYRATRAADGALRARLTALAQERRRFGYRRLHVLLRREGHAANQKRVQRLYREERLTVRRRGERKRAMGTRRSIETPTAQNQRGSLDFVSDQLTDCRRFRILAVVDDCTRDALRWWRTRRCRAGAWRASSMRSSASADAGRTRSSVTMEPSTPRTRSSPGRTKLASAGIISRPASRSRTASSRASMVACATSYSAKRSSAHCGMRVRCSKSGGATTTRHGHTRNSD